MGVVIAAVVPGAAAGPAEIFEAAQTCGHEPVFIAVAGALAEEEKAFHASFGPIVECDPDAPDRVIAQLNGYRPDGITTFSEGMVPLTATLAAELRLPYHSRETVTMITDKWAQRQRLAQAGVDAVWSVMVKSRAEALAALEGRPGPAVVKPVRSLSSRDTYFVPNPGQFPADLTPTAERPFVVEEFLPGRAAGDFGDYVSVESFMTDDRIFTLGVTGKFPLLPPFREQGQIVPCHLPPAESDQIAQLAADALRALGVSHGLSHTEIKLTPGGPRIIEVNGRIGGNIGELYSRATGANLLALGISEACGQPVTPSLRPCDTVEFQFWNSPPVGGGILCRVDGAERVREEPNVLDYRLRVPVGKKLPPEVMTFMLDFLRGSAPDYDTMLKVIDNCLEYLMFVFEQAPGRPREWRASRRGLCTNG